MEAYEHALISAVAAPLAVWSLFGATPVTEFLSLAFFGFCCGVFIDFDHFIVQRLRDGNWKHLKTGIGNLKGILTDNTDVLEDRISEQSRYISHFAVLAVFPVAVATFNLKLGALAYVMVGSHLSCDIYRSWREDSKILD